MAMKESFAFPIRQPYWNLTIKLFSVISSSFIGGVALPLYRGAVGIFYSPSQLGKGVLRYTSLQIPPYFFSVVDVDVNV